MHRLCLALGVARSPYQAWKAKKTHQRAKADSGASVRVGSVFREHRGLYGAPRITAELRP